MNKIMKVIPETATDKWFKGLPAKHRVKVKELQQARMGITNRHQKAVPAMAWWSKQGWVRKSDIYKVYHDRFEKSKSKGDTTPSKTKEVN